ncbi:probable glutathione s-transferase-related transmembrane protein [Plesiocystis pacifica SIR-1]|uniref:glutathione transferase n=1 Tax=Plesiocystis pacifica SIR-1 TaxID=391625 RepID=A6FXJ2_9BACT|nr:glutathione S-transferase family protein [Plesiocystis pacifica]EDM81580.1 probable glutathione s-transferase-related transmembrane protein [Plesiocystis pacifica SIR-1]
MSVTLTGFQQSSYVWTARAALAHKGVDYEFKPIVPPANRSPEHLEQHPWGKVPIFSHGDFKLYETTAICTYVNEAFEGPALLPGGAKEHARAQLVISVANSYLYPEAVVRYALQYIFPRGEGGQPDRATIDAAVPEVAKALDVLERELGEKQWFVGDGPTLADYFVGPLVAVVGMFPEGKQLMSERPQLGRHLGQLMALDSFRAGAPQG